MQQAFALISAVLLMAAAPPYVIDILRGKTRPERVTWLIFSILGLIAFFSQLALGGSWSLVFSGVDTAASILVFALSIKYGVGGFTKLDISALVIAGVGVAIAITNSQPIISLLGVILADVSGVVLTIRKTYLDPDSETTITWVLVGTASLFGLFAVGNLSPSLLIYPFYLMLVNYSIPVTQVAGRRAKSSAKSRPV